MAGKLVKRTLDIIKSGVDEKVKDYTSNWTQFTSDAREVKDILIKGETNAADTVQKLKRTGITKKISDWFYGAETEFESSGSDSDFDPGFSVESASDGKLDGDKSSSALTYDSMKDLSAKQTGMMVKIGRRQTEQSVANTAEVISTINNRTAEMVAVMNNINTSLKGVNDRLDKLIKIQSLGIEAEEERALGGEGGLYDSNGMLSLKGVFDAARTTGGGKFGQTLQALGMAKGNIGPEMLFGLALDSVLGRQRSSLGGKSVNELGKEFNEFIGNGIQTALTNVITGKAFKSLFGDITGFEADKNYGDLRNARYDTKRAQFDNMTRHSIVKIMPELLIKLNENLSGKSYHINQNGDIVEGPAKNYFREAVSGAVGSANITSRAYSNINQGMKQVFNKEIPKEDIDAAADALLRYYVDYGHRKGNIITKDDIRNTSPEAIGTVCDIIGMTNTDSSKGYNYWSKVCQTILYKVTNGNSFDAHAFINSINQSIRNTQSAAAEQARGFYGDQAGKITLDILKTGYVEKYGSEAQRNQISRSTTTTASKFTTADYVKGIFALLNRGINVKLEGKGTYRKLTEADVKKEPWLIQSTNDEAAARLFGALTGDKNAIKGSMESALGLLGAANDATGGKVGALQTAAALSTMFNQGKGFFDNIRNKQLTQNLVTALHGDASALKTQVGGKFDQAKNAAVNNLPYGMTHDQRMIDMANSVRGIGNNMLQHGANALNAGRQKFQNQNTVSGPGRLANNLMYNMDTRALNKATNRVMNFSTNGLNDHDVQWFNDAKGLMESQDYWNARDLVDNMHDDKARNYLLNQIDKVTNITQNRMLGESKLAKGERPDIGAVRMAAPDKKNDVNNPKSGLYKLIKGGFNLTTTILKGLFKLAASGASDVFYGMKSFGWGMFGGKNEDGSRHHGLIENLTFDFARGARNLGVGSLKKLAGKARDKWDAGDSGHYKNQRTNDDGSIDFINYTRGEWRDKQKAEGQDLKSRLKGKEFGTNMSAWDALTHPIKAVATAFKDVTEPLRKFTKTVVDGAKSIAGSIADWIKGTTLGKAAGWLGNKASGLFTASEFGKGFTKAWREKSEAKKAKQFDAQREESFINSATGKLMDMISGKDSSMLTQLADILKKIELNTLPEEERKKRLEQQNDQQGTDEEGKGEGNAEGDEDENKGKSKGILGKVKGFFGKKKKNKDPNGDDSAGKGEGGDGTEGEGTTAGVPADGGNVGKATKSPGGEGAAAGAGSAAGKGKNALSGNVGAILGGIFKSVGGIFKMATSVVLAMEGLETIKTLVTDIFKKGLKPLNQVFQKVYHMIKPLATQLTNIVKEIAKALTQMLDGVLKTLTPLLKMISDAISTIFETVLQPVMEILDATLSACMVPITLCLDAMKPALDIICNDLKIVSGVVQMGMGGIMGLLGGIGSGIGAVVSGIGKLLKKLGARSAGKKLIKVGGDVSEAAGNMLENSKSMMVNGAQQFKEGLAGQLTVVKKLVTLDYLGDEEEEKKETVIDEERANKVNLSDAGANFGSGDVNNYNTWNYTYGSGNTMNQHTYGPTMNMAERGCGPVALADAYMRRTGSGMNPLTLAGAMMGNGSYEPNRGTSVASMVNTGRALGMNMQLGGVTQRSLNGASPSNPITIMGSGSGFGTKRGNDHYLNVVGSDGRGNSYVSNPLTGRVSKTPTSQLALNSRLGLYGSGDKLPDEFGIDLDSMTALERLQSLSERFQKIFTGDSTVDKTKKTIEAGKTANMSATLDAQLGDLTDEQQKAIIANAKKQYLDDHRFRAQRDGESDEDYKKAFEADFEKNGGNYINKAKQDILEERARERKNNAETDAASIQTGLEGIGGANKAMISSAKTDDIEDDDGSEGSVNSWQGAEMSPFSPLVNKIVNITNSAMDNKSPVHDYFSATGTGAFSDDSSSYGKDLYTLNGGWYKKGTNPNKEGEGSTGYNTEGVVIRYGGFRKNPDVRAITPGTVVYISKNGGLGGKDPNGGYGNSVKWRDAAGMYHWYMGLSDIDSHLAVGNDISANQILGHMGHTGLLDEQQMYHYKQYINATTDEDRQRHEDDMGTMLRYIVTHTGGNQVGDEVNPLTYWKYEEIPEADPDNVAGNTVEAKVFNFLTALFNGNKKAAAGAVGVMMNEGLGNVNAPGTLEGVFTKDPSMYEKTSTLDMIDKYTQGTLFPSYEKSGVSYNSNGYLYNGKYLAGIGMAQWTGERTAKLMEYAKNNNKKWTDLATQLSFFASEESDYSSLYDYMRNAKTVQDAADAWMTQYEAGGTGTNPQVTMLGNMSGAIEARRKSANDAYAKLQNSNVESSDLNPAGIEVNGNDKNFRFVSSMRNVEGGDANDFVLAVASAFKSYVDSKGEQYAQADVGPITSDDGYTWDHFRPDCSGFIAAGIRKMGYDFSGSENDITGPKTYDFNEYRDKYGLKILTGGDRSNWALIPFDEYDMHYGDVMFKPDNGTEYYPGSHTGMYLGKNANGSFVGLDGGSTSNIGRSYTTAKSLLEGSWKSGDNATYTIQPSNYPDMVLRYVGKAESDDSDKAPLLGSWDQYGDLTSDLELGQYGYDPNNASTTKWKAEENKTNAEKANDWQIFYGDNVRDVLHNSQTISSYLKKMHDYELKEYTDITFDDYSGDPNAIGAHSWSNGAAWSYYPSEFDYPMGHLLDSLVGSDRNYPVIIKDKNMGKDAHALAFKFDKKSNKWVKALPGNDDSTNWEHVRKVLSLGGSGDVSPEVPAVDMSQLFDETSQTMRNATNAFNGGGTTVVVARDDQSTNDMIARLSEITFKVRNERVEELLEEIVDYIKTPKKKSSSTFNHVHGSNNYTIEDMFEDEIPEAVMRLSKGG